LLRRVSNAFRDEQNYGRLKQWFWSRRMCLRFCNNGAYYSRKQPTTSDKSILSGGPMRRTTLLSVMLWSVVLLPAAARAQSSEGGSIAGIVRDTSGAVMPGVTVEAASPALIEKLRSAVTDERGLYRIVDLRPGSYSVTFALPGFTSLTREGIELTTSFTATGNAEMNAGSL